MKTVCRSPRCNDIHTAALVAFAAFEAIVGAVKLAGASSTSFQKDYVSLFWYNQGVVSRRYQETNYISSYTLGRISPAIDLQSKSDAKSHSILNFDIIYVYRFGENI